MKRNRMFPLAAAGAAAVAWAALGAQACLDDPELRGCIDFPIGSEGCPSGCEVYCGEIVETCPGQFQSLGQCITECAAEPINPTITDGEFGDVESNTLSCRLTYLRAGDCQNASLLDSEMCVGASCATYCELMEQNCSGAYPSVAICEQNCAEFPVRPLNRPEADDDTVDCRFRYASLAGSEPGGPACDAASLNGGGVCGDEPCVPFCALVTQNCTGVNTVYEDTADCLRQCGFLNGAGRFNDWDFSTEADSVQCRSYHAGPPAAEVPTTHCPHTRVYNEEHCGIRPPGLSEQPADWPCITFCGIMARRCPGAFDTMDACRTTCAAFPEVVNIDPDNGPQLFPVTSSVCPTFD